MELSEQFFAPAVIARCFLDSAVMAISREDVLHVAKLARLALSDDEIDQLTEELGAILNHVAQIEALDTKGVEPTAHPIPLVNVLRPDVVVPGVDREEVLAQAPSVEDHRFRVPRILEEP